MTTVLHRFEHNHVFTEPEAWLLFKLAAYGEAIGWTLLIAGILSQRYIWRHSGIPVLLAGQTHGMLFLAYALAALGLYPNLGWSRWRGVLATLASVPPYGSLLFEQWAAYKRHHEQVRMFSYLWAWTLLDARYNSGSNVT